MNSVDATVFETRCLELVDEVARTRSEIVVTRHGRPIDLSGSLVLPESLDVNRGAARLQSDRLHQAASSRHAD